MRKSTELRFNRIKSHEFRFTMKGRKSLRPRTTASSSIEPDAMHTCGDQAMIAPNHFCNFLTFHWTKDNRRAVVWC